MEEQNYYAIILTKLLRNKKVKDKAKLLYADISSLTKVNGYCYASNEYFANLYDVAKETISRLLKNLEENGYIRLEYKMRGAEVVQRLIYLHDCEKSQSSNDKKVNRTNDKKVKYNNIIKKNKNINIINFNNGCFASKHNYLTNFFSNYELNVYFSIEDVLEIFNYYYAKYESVFRVPHPRLKQEQLGELLDSINCIKSPFSDDVVCDIDTRTYIGMINNYFDYSSGMNNADGNINHFWSIRYTQYHEYLKNEDL